MKAIRFVALLLVLVTVLPLAVSAYGKDDSTLLITHINTSPSTEGSAIILSGSSVKKLGEKGTFAWWTVLIFDWDAKQSCFVLKESNTNASNVDKSQMEIPENGFAYCICVGNDYSSSGGINYVTDRIKKSNEYARSLQVGDKAYLYGTNLSAGSIKTNGKEWYGEDFISNSYVKIGSPAEGETAYDPIKNKGDLPQLVISPNYYNSKHYAEQDCILFDASFGSYVQNVYDYSWWRCLIFDWDPAEGCYVVTAVDTSVGSGLSKAPVIPKNGFVILDCASASQNSIQAASVGNKAYFYKENGTYTICLNQPMEGKTALKPGNAESIQAAPFLKMAAKEKCTPEGYTVEWEPVAGAKSYTVSVNSSTSNNLCKLIVQPTKVSGTSYTIPKEKMEIGGAYTVTVSADNSMSASAKLYCFSAEALDCNLSDKTVLAFGDSLTARSGWVAMLGGYIGTEVINAGVGGDSTINAVGRLERDVLSKKPDVALVCFGMNDQAQSQSKNAPNVSLEKYTENMIHIIEELQAIGTEVILIAPHDAYAANGFYSPGGYGLDYAYGNMKDFCNVVRELAEEYDCGLIDIYAEAEQEDMTKFLAAGDGIHQSPEGHKLWAKYVSEYLLAVYDGKNAVTVPVKIQFDDGDVMECGLWVMAEGATMYVPVPKEAEGCTPRRITGAAGVDVTYIVAGKRPEESTEESAEESEEVSEEASETVSEAASATESTGETEETDSSVAIWLICIGAVLVCGGVVAFLRKRK